MPASPLSASEIERALQDLSDWSLVGGKLHREYAFADFVLAWGFMSACALKIQQMDHHPEWFNVYGTVRVDLVTHDAGGISARDVALAKEMEALAARFTASA